MKIYTKKGDQGDTYLLGGRKVKKNDLRLMSYGSVDELNSFLGLVRSYKISKHYQDKLIKIQQDLFIISGNLAKIPEAEEINLLAIKQTDVERLENEIDKLENGLSKLNAFIIPGGSQAVASCHVARSVCRRAERITVGLSEAEEVDETILKYLNRLSDYLFVLARSIASDEGVEEVKLVSSI